MISPQLHHFFYGHLAIKHDYLMRVFYYQKRGQVVFQPLDGMSPEAFEAA
jgi:hypothetical protein